MTFLKSPVWQPLIMKDWIGLKRAFLSSVFHHHFNLEFDISRYLTILGDEVTNEIPMRRNNTSMALGLGKVDK
jgi:hypothetical protein